MGSAVALKYNSAPMTTMRPAYIALGSNIGDRERNIQRALEHLRATPCVQVMSVSRLMETSAVGGPEGSPDYLNAAARIDTSLKARTLLQRLLEIEHIMGRRRRIRWEPRQIDLDLLLYDNQVISSADMVIPHPRMHERRFVLEPLSQIAENLTHPTLGATIGELLSRLA